MRNAGVTRDPIASFPLPPDPPATVLEAQREFDRIGDQWGAVKGEIADAEEEIKRAIDADVEAAAEAYAAGKQPKALNGKEHEARTKKDVLGRQAAALSVALDRAGNQLARTVAESRDEWAESLGELAQEAEERLAVALAKAQAAADKLGKARRAREWVENFDAAEAIVRRVPPYTGGILRVNLGFGLRGEQHVATVLKLVEEAVAADAPRPGTRRHKVASSR